VCSRAFCSRSAWPSVSIWYCTIHLSLIIITIYMLLIINLYCCLCVVCYYALSCWTFQLHFRPFFAIIQRKLLDQSIWRNQWLYLTFQYMPTYVLRACLYVFSITLDRLVLCTPSVLRFLLECFHLGVYAPTGIFLFVAEWNTEYWFYTIFCFYMLSHMPSLLCGCWPFPSTLCFIYSLMVFYIFSGVSSFILYVFFEIDFFEFELS